MAGLALWRLPTEILTTVAKAFVFRGRAPRREFWVWSLAVVLIWLGIVLGAAGLRYRPGWFLWLLLHPPLAAWLFAAAALVPSLSAAARRLHDVGRSGWWLVLLLVPPAATLGLMLLVDIFFGRPDPTGALVLGVFTLWLGALAEIAVAILLLVWFARPGESRENRFGLPAAPQ